MSAIRSAPGTLRLALAVAATVTTLALLPAMPAAAMGVVAGGQARAANEPDAAGGSSSRSPVVQFSTPGLHTVTLTSCNAVGCSAPVSQQVMVVDPRPLVTAATVAPAQAYSGQLLLLAAQATGQPALNYSWQVLLGPTAVATQNGPAATLSTAGIAAGTYTVKVTVSNLAGSASTTRPLSLLPQVSDVFFTLPPCRLIDTRLGAPLTTGAAPRVIAIAGTCGIPATARAVAVNVTAVTPTTGGFITVYPADYPQSFTSLVNFNAGAVRAAFAVLPLSTDGLGQLAASSSAGQVDLLLDVAGYFAPHL